MLLERGFPAGTTSKLLNTLDEKAKPPERGVRNATNLPEHGRWSGCRRGDVLLAARFYSYR